MGMIYDGDVGCRLSLGRDGDGHCIIYFILVLSLRDGDGDGGGGDEEVDGDCAECLSQVEDMVGLHQRLLKVLQLHRDRSTAMDQLGHQLVRHRCHRRQARGWDWRWGCETYMRYIAQHGPGRDCYNGWL